MFYTNSHNLLIFQTKHYKDRIINGLEKVESPSFPLQGYHVGIIDLQGQIVGGQIWSKFEHIQDIMCVLITYQFKKIRDHSNREPEDQWS